MGWSDELSYPTGTIDSLAVFVASHEDAPLELRAWAHEALADVADALAQRPLFGAGGREVDDDWQVRG